MRSNCAIRLAAPLALTAMLLTVAACGKGRGPLDVLGVTVPPPDEFQVIARKPLQLPPSATLPEPRPGAASPLDPDPHSDARRALLGTSGSPVVATAPTSPGEQVLLSSADAAAASSEIRVQLEDDKVKEEANKPYEPPSLGELLGGGGGEKLDEEELLDPIAESQRLQREGLATPVDPEAASPEDAEASSDRDPITYYPPGRPESPIAGQSQTPKY